MPDPPSIKRLRGLVLSATEVKSLTGWPAAMVEDYLNILDNIITLANLIDVEIDQKIEEIATDLPEDELIAPSGGFLRSTGVTVDDIESRSFFFSRIY